MEGAKRQFDLLMAVAIDGDSGREKGENRMVLVWVENSHCSVPFFLVNSDPIRLSKTNP